MARPRLGRKFFDVPCADLASALLGQIIVRMVDGTRLAARIVETEAYLGHEDKAAHSYKGPTDRNQAMYMDPGTAYVYMIYGLHYCFNISSRGTGCAVLIRSLEPVEGIAKMRQLRQGKKNSHTTTTSTIKVHHLTNGPSKLCQALDITKQKLNQHDLVGHNDIWLEEGDKVSSERVVVSARVNIGYAEEWTEKPLRFYVLHSPCISIRDKVAEQLLLEFQALNATPTKVPSPKITSTHTAGHTSVGSAAASAKEIATAAASAKEIATAAASASAKEIATQIGDNPFVVCAATTSHRNKTGNSSRKKGKRKLKPSGSEDQLETASAAAKSAKKQQAATSPYFSNS